MPRREPSGSRFFLAYNNSMPSILIGIILIIFLIFGFTALTGAPYVPSMKKELREAFTRLYPLSKKDLLVDLGSGDGVVLKIASEYGAKGFGVELNPALILISRWRLRKCANTKIVGGDLFKQQFPKETTVVYLFGDSRDIAKMVLAIQAQANRLNKSLYLISNAFEIPGLKIQKKHRAYFLYLIKPQRKTTALN